jgi:hypothetical protein
VIWHHLVKIANIGYAVDRAKDKIIHHYGQLLFNIITMYFMVRDTKIAVTQCLNGTTQQQNKDKGKKYLHFFFAILGVYGSSLRHPCSFCSLVDY